ncbi:MAG: YqeG family HAD IIIA-type phosphatase [Peptococcaceae bacterium]|nr:MAG: YqeG family HAD IIIA-type phosphatase [Peptococcaceae bacterium]
MKRGVLELIDLFCPKAYVSSVFDVDLQQMTRQGIKGIFLDLDNTIIRRDVALFSPDMVRWLQELRCRGFKVVVVSNNSHKRVSDLVDPLGIPAVCRAVKPWKRPFRRALEILGTEPRETALIGDQIFTDIFGGNRMGLYTILVKPMPGREFWGTKLFSRQLEKLILKRIGKFF